MKKVYLKNGQEAFLKEQIGDRFIINTVSIYQGAEGSPEIELVGDDELVNEVFEHPPTEKISQEVLELKDEKRRIDFELTLLKEEKAILDKELKEMVQTQINSNKFILNRTDLLNAKELVLFPKDLVMPIIKRGQEESMRGLKLVLDIVLATGMQRAWGYRLYYDNNSSNSLYLCEKYGILIDPTPEEVDLVIMKRLTELKFTDQAISQVPDKFLTEKLLDIKNDFLKTRNKVATEAKLAQIKRLEQELQKLQEIPEIETPKTLI